MAKRKRLAEMIEHDPQEELQRDRDKRTAKLANEQLAKQYKEALAKIDELSEQVEALTALDKRKPVKAYSVKTDKRKSDATAIVVFSDWHVGEVVQPEKVGGLNEYNPGIAEQRSKAVIERALLMIDDSRNLANVDTLVVALLGDFITGWIHDENEQTNALTPIEETQFAADLIEKSLLTIAERSGCKRIIVPTCVGNHGRTTKKTQAANRNATSFEYGMYKSLRRRLNSSVFDWRVGEGYQEIVKIQDHVLRLHHGDSIKYQGGIGGLTIPTIKQIHRRNTKVKAHHDFFGHLHTWTPGDGFTCNGSLIGYNAYADFLGLPYQEPLQTFALCDHRRGITRNQKLFTD
jgi:hypothetical protein